MRSRRLKTTVRAAVAGAIWTQLPQVPVRLIRRRPSVKCWFMGHEDWIRRTPDRLYLECCECGRATQGWVTGKRHQTDRAGGAVEAAPVIRRNGHSPSTLVRSPMSPSPTSECSITHYGGDLTIAA